MNPSVSQNTYVYVYIHTIHYIPVALKKFVFSLAPSCSFLSFHLEGFGFLRAVCLFFFFSQIFSLPQLAFFSPFHFLVLGSPAPPADMFQRNDGLR